MSTYVSDLITQALNEIADKDGHRTTRADMLTYYTRAHEKMALTLRCLQSDYYFDLVKGEPRYYYPEDSIQIAGIRIARVAQPTQLSDYYWLDEKFTEEYRRVTWAYRPAAWVYAYHARPQWFELLNSPVADVTDGGIISVWHIPYRITTETPSAVMEVRDFLRGSVIEGMKVLARNAGRERVAAEAEWRQWVSELETYREKIEDPSDDRRDSLRPPGHDHWLGYQR